MHFVPASESLPAALPEPRHWRAPLFASALAAAFAATQPWTRVRFERLFGEHFGPPAWQSTAGFTCLCTAALVSVMALAETRSRTTHDAVRPASLLIAAVAALALLYESLGGPGSMRGVSASWTYAFWLAAIGVPALLFVCAARALPPAATRS